MFLFTHLNNILPFPCQQTYFASMCLVMRFYILMSLERWLSFLGWYVVLSQLRKGFLLFQGSLLPCFLLFIKHEVSLFCFLQIYQTLSYYLIYWTFVLCFRFLNLAFNIYQYIFLFDFIYFRFLKIPLLLIHFPFLFHPIDFLSQIVSVYNFFNSIIISLLEDILYKILVLLKTQRPILVNGLYLIELLTSIESIKHFSKICFGTKIDDTQRQYTEVIWNTE